MSVMTNYNESTRSPYDDSVIIVERETGEKILEAFDYNYMVTGNEPVHTVMEGETLQSIAFFYYKDSGFWSRICDVNNIIDPLSEEEFYSGLQLIIPNL